MILFINGASNTGKSTVAHLLTQYIPDSIVIEIDTFIAASKNPHPPARIQEGIQKGIQLTKHSLSQGQNIILPFPLSDKHYNFFKQAFQKHQTKMFFFTLDPSLETAKLFRGRKLTPKEGQRIRRFYELNLHRPSFGTIINTENHTPIDTATVILHSLQTQIDQRKK